MCHWNWIEWNIPSSQIVCSGVYDGFDVDYDIVDLNEERSRVAGIENLKMITPRRKTFSLKYKEPKLDSLQGLISELTLNKRSDFEKDYGKILNLLFKKIDYGIISSLAQYYDLPLRCFTFSDFQLAHTLEEVERIMGLKLKDFNPSPKLEEEVGPKKIMLVLGTDVPTVLANWIEKGCFKGFAMRFLEELALKFKKARNWKAFYDVLDLLIHGIMLFPNIEKFMDHVVVEVFLSGNHVSFLLADIYHVFHARHEKRGETLLCCAPLLYTWFMQHMPEKGHFIAKELKYPQRLASLTATTKGCINYNPMLSQMQHNYSMNGPPEAKDLQLFVLFDIQVSNPDVRTIRKTWLKIVRKVPELKPILPEDVEKLNAKVKELELENIELRIKMN
ncbi:uncharacterized protein LOC127138094 [Lathyrus oleraceus]|uniref:uncharacterized protein LOC127138094 n=1 Tax=Pisum sativum TaxID=3888 RepID=UPI0021D39C6F|nr:uncharacterized protein LOC127138094 [Pisum sativum]